MELAIHELAQNLPHSLTHFSSVKKRCNLLNPDGKSLLNIVVTPHIKH